MNSRSKTNAGFGKIWFLSLAIFLLSACGSKSTNADSSAPVWVYAQFNVPENQEYIETYWYYGLVDGDLFNAISSNEVTEGFITLEQVRYWGDDDRIELYEDNMDSGDITFRIEHLVKFNAMKGPLEKGFSYPENMEIMDDRPDVEPPSPTAL